MSYDSTISGQNYSGLLQLQQNFTCLLSPIAFNSINLVKHTSSHAQESQVLVRKRNERERERVRCVNSHYERLRKKIPFLQERTGQKRISKVEILRAAIQYIRCLEVVLQNENNSTTATASKCELCYIEAQTK